MANHAIETVVHRAHSYEYANAGARTGATGFVTADLNKLALQTDTGIFYRLSATTPTWVQVTGTGAISIPFNIIAAISDETTAITTGTAKITFRMPAAVNITSVTGSLATSSSSGNPAFNVKKNGTTIFSTTLTIDSGELTSVTAATPFALTTSPTAFAADDAVTIDIDTAGTGAKGAKIALIGTYQ